MNKAKWIIFISVVISLFVVLLFINNSQKQDYSNIDATQIISDGPIADHVEGSTDSKVLLIEYGDFQCTACLSYYYAIGELIEEYGDKLTFVFRNFPIVSSHANALAAATAAEAAGLNGKYFEMYHILHQNQSSWSNLNSSDRTEMFKKYAEYLELDVDQFISDLSNDDIQKKINRDKTTALKQFGLTGTPTFILNGEKLGGDSGVSKDELRQSVEDALTKVYGSLEAAKQE